MKTIVVTGGTSGIGEALARIRLDEGDQVVVVARDPEKGARFLAAAERAGAGDRAVFIRADLSLAGENRRVLTEIAARFPAVDALVLCARSFRSHRTVTAEGLEHNLALFYLSRYQLGHGLADRLAAADAPVIVNVAGPGVGPGNIRWDDLGMEHGYDGWSAMFQGGRLNDLLGVAFAARHPGHPARYVLLFPGGTRTGFAGEFDAVTAAQVAAMKEGGQPVEVVTAPISAIIDAPPREPLSAFAEGRRIDLRHPSFDQVAAARLDARTRVLLGTEHLDDHR